MSIAHHDFEYEQDFLVDGYTAGCSCGWRARQSRTTLELAQEDWDGHCEQVFVEATGG